MKKLLKEFKLIALFALFFLALANTYHLKAQEFLRPDSLRFGDSSSYYQTTPWGPIYLEISDSTGTGAALRVDTVFAYYITWTGDTVKGTWQREKTNSRDTILVPGNGKTGVWKLLDTENPKGIKIVRTNDSGTVNMKMTKVTLYGVRRLYNNILKYSTPQFTSNGKPFYLRNSFYKQGKPEYSVKNYRPDKLTLNDKLGIFGQMRW